MKYIISYSVKKGLPDISLLTGGVYFGYYERYHLNISNRISNPWRVKALRKLTGLAPEVQEFLTRCKRTEEHLSLFYNKFKYGRRVVSIGCTGGKHRSVAMAEMLAARMRTNGMKVTVIHRDLPVEVSNG